MNKNIQKDKIPADLHTGIYDERKDGMFADEGLLRDGGSSAVMGAQLLAAARDGDTTAVRTLLSMPGAQSFVDYQDEHGATPLHLATCLSSRWPTTSTTTTSATSWRSWR